MPGLTERHEARKWLQDNPNDSAFASNRFGPTEDALDFVEYLYELGAVRVEVTNLHSEDWRIRLEGGPYADTLVVTLPDDPAQRAELFGLANEEDEEGDNPIKDGGETELILWWD